MDEFSAFGNLLNKNNYVHQMGLSTYLFLLFAAVKIVQHRMISLILTHHHFIFVACKELRLRMGRILGIQVDSDWQVVRNIPSVETAEKQRFWQNERYWPPFGGQYLSFFRNLCFAAVSTDGIIICVYRATPRIADFKRMS